MCCDLLAAINRCVMVKEGYRVGMYGTGLEHYFMGLANGQRWQSGDCNGQNEGRKDESGYRKVAEHSSSISSSAWLIFHPTLLLLLTIHFHKAFYKHDCAGAVRSLTLTPFLPAIHSPLCHTTPITSNTALPQRNFLTLA